MKKYRNHIIKVIILFFLLLLGSCHPDRIIHNILKDEIVRARLYHEILKNEAYRAQLLDSIQNNKANKKLE